MINATILIVDDEMGFVETMAKRLQKRNMTVYKAYDGDAALNQLEKYTDVQVVILDMKMPGKDGLTVCRNQGSISVGGSDHAHRACHGSHCYRRHSAWRVRLFDEAL